MSNTLQSLLRITSWPSNLEFPTPQTFGMEVTDAQGAWLRCEQRLDLTKAPEDAAFFDIADADPADSTSMVDLAKVLHVDLVPTGTTRWSDVLDERVLGIKPARRKYHRLVSDWAKQSGLEEPDQSSWPESGPRDLLDALVTKVHVSEISLRVSTVQSMVATLGRGVPSLTDAPKQKRAAAPAQSTAWMNEHFRLQLDRLAPRIQFFDEDQAPRPTTWRATAFELATLDLFNALNRPSGLKRCAECQRVFSRQVGRAQQDREQTHRRQDIKFCSPQCARAHAVREFRKRKKAGG